MKADILALVCLVSGGCSAPTPPSATKKAAAPVKPSDESRRFPVKNRLKIELVEQKMLGRDFLPGSNLAEYESKGKKYQQFLVAATDAQHAAVWLFDFKNTLSDPKYLAHMGGFFGMEGARPVYVFAEGAFLAGIVGLPQDQAEPLAREFAARL